MLSFLGTGHFLKISLALLAMSSIGNTLWTEVKDVESHVLGFMSPAFEKAALLFAGKRRLSGSRKPGGKKAVAMLLSGSAVAHLIVAMSLICSRLVFVTGRGGAGFHFVTPPLLRPGVNALPFLPAPYDTGPWPGCGAGRVFYFPR